jgi:hypothetical protein
VITDLIDALQPAAMRVGAMILLAAVAIWIIAGRRR